MGIKKGVESTWERSVMGESGRDGGRKVVSKGKWRKGRQGTVEERE